MKYIILSILSLSLFSCKPSPYLKPDDPFIKAIEADDFEKVKALVESGKVISEATLGGDSPAKKAQSVQMLKTLEELGFPLKSNVGKTNLVLAILNGKNSSFKPEVLRVLAKDYGYNVNEKNVYNGDTPAISVVTAGNSDKVEKLKILKECGADFSLKNKKGKTLYQVSRNYKDIIAYLESIGIKE